MELLKCVEKLEDKREPYCPIVEDISMDDSELLDAVNHIEQDWVFCNLYFS